MSWSDSSDDGFYSDRTVGDAFGDEEAPDNIDFWVTTYEHDVRDLEMALRQVAHSRRAIVRIHPAEPGNSLLTVLQFGPIVLIDPSWDYDILYNTANGPVAMSAATAYYDAFAAETDLETRKTLYMHAEAAVGPSLPLQIA
ncbi:hypothetical protein BD626DRAFT_533232 [Schizophyllum amplum]|uniref:Uncharacterized protein n=1 Tax=Schizophyllum amplum TaxID=97359 RepID=A0A550CXX0_9AGAR|nr:hypothetical protein BD626DRAFT_533232 [Auriculariopsis ampla]